MNEMVRRDEWNPTPEEFAAYRKRDIELCQAAVKKDPTLKQSHTLFSVRTWQLAGFTI